MNNKIILILLLSIFLNSCEKEKPITFSSESFTEESLDRCKNVSCPEVTINYVIVDGEKAVSEKINKTLTDSIIAILYMGDEEKPSEAKTIAEAADHFIKMYRMHSAEFPDLMTEYFAEINVNDLYNSEEIISFEIKTYLYRGGAHGYGMTLFLNFDPLTGELISPQSLFKNKKEFSAFAESKFREANAIPKNENINSTGFYFEEDTFFTPENIGVTNDSIILIYNPYEIGSYAEGAIQLNISREEAAPFLMIQ